MTTTTTMMISQKRIATFLRLFKAKEGAITSANGLLWVTDNESSICIGELEGNHYAVLKFTDLRRAVTAAGAASDLTFTVNDGTFVVECDKLGETEIVTSKYSDGSVDVMADMGEYVCTIGVAEIKKAMTIIDRCSSESSRLALGCVLIEAKAIVCADGYRLAKLAVQQDHVPDTDEDKTGNKSWSVLIPASVIKYADAFGEPIDVFEKMLTAGDLACSRPDGRYPNWRQVLHIGADNENIVDGSDIRAKCVAAIARYKALKTKPLNCPIEIDLPVADDKTVEITVDARYMQPIVGDSKAFTIRWSSKNVKVPSDAEAKTGWKVRIEGPLLCESTDRPDWHEVLMAMSKENAKK